jgi:hypothetical protein
MDTSEVVVDVVDAAASQVDLTQIGDALARQGELLHYILGADLVLIGVVLAAAVVVVFSILWK